MTFFRAICSSLLKTLHRQAGQVLEEYSAASVIEMITSLQSYEETTLTAKSLVQPFVYFHSEGSSVEHADEVSALCYSQKKDLIKSGTI